MSDTQTESPVVSYLKQKNLPYRESGDAQVCLQVCPFCSCAEWKFFINSVSFLWDCKRCREVGNEYKLKKQFGDAVQQPQYQPSQAVNRPEALPDMEAAHAALLANDAAVNYLNDERGWSYDVIKALKLGLGPRNFEGTSHDCIIYPYYVKGVLQYAKWRTMPPAPKDFRVTQNRPAPLYNQDVITEGMEELFLVEGESDTISHISNGYPNTVGIPGADGKKTLWIDKLDRAKPKRMYLIYDNDKVGQDGAKEMAVKIGIDKQLFNIVLPQMVDDVPVKDLSEWWRAGGTPEQFEQLKAEAKQFDVDGMITIEDGLYQLENEVEEKGNLLPDFGVPWDSLRPKFGGFDRGELVGVSAEEKMGKTTFVMNWLDWLALQGWESLLDCYEVPEKKNVRKWASYVTRTDDSPGTPFQTDKEYAKEVFRKAREIRSKYPAQLRFGYSNKLTLDGLFEKWYQAVRRYGVSVIALDNLQLVADRTLGRNKGERHSHLSYISKSMKAFCMEMKVGGVLIIQPRKIRDGEIATSRDNEGSGATGKDVDYELLLHRNRMGTKKTADLEKMGTLDVPNAYSPRTLVTTDLSRFGPGGRCELYMEGQMSWFREKHEADPKEERSTETPQFGSL